MLDRGVGCGFLGSSPLACFEAFHTMKVYKAEVLASTSAKTKISKNLEETAATREASTTVLVVLVLNCTYVIGRKESTGTTVSGTRTPSIQVVPSLVFT